MSLSVPARAEELAPRRLLSRRASFWTAAAVAGASLWSSAAPTTTYPLYAGEWHLSPTATTAIFAVYPLVLVGFLLVFGQLSDYIGRRATMLYGLVGMLAGTVLFAVAPSVAWVYLGRGLVGAGVGLALTPATAAVLEYSARGKAARASSVTTAATAAGLALATVVGGGLVEYGPAPLHSSFWVLTGVILVLGVFVWRMPRDGASGAWRQWRPRPIRIPRGLRLLYAASALAVTAAYSFGSVFLALGADVARALVGTSNTLVIGLVLAIMSAMIGVTAVLAARRLGPARQVMAGSATTLAALGLLETSATAHSLPLFVLTTVLGGISYGLLFSGGLGLISAHAPAAHRGGTVAAVYLVAYVLQGGVALALGVVATSSGLSTALVLGVVGIASLALLALVITLVVGASARAIVAPEVR